jgi:pimeloyl-ACP methyl ester carboxylesterase
MAQYIFVHGCWQAGWCWEKIKPYVVARGHKMLALDLPGHGANKKELSKVTYKDYYDCLKNAVLSFCEPVVVVAHSMSGILAGPLQEELPDRIQHLYLIAAYVPESGKSLLDIAGNYTGSLLPTILEHDLDQNIWTLKTKEAKDVLYHGCQKEIQEWAVAQLQAEPVQPCTEPIHCTYRKELADKRTYILCEQDRDVDPQAQKDMAAKWPSKLVSLPTGHFPFLSEPEKTAQILDFGYIPK